MVDNGRSDGDDESNIDGDADGTRRAYEAPAHSESFLQHLESVSSSWPHDKNDDNYDELNIGDEDKRYKSGNDWGVCCTGEPSIDPSRMVQNVVIDGECDWM